ncbi:DUF308 domain-containing protein [Halorussus halophilus]|uniref:DUF308 domain-containing protein n=1 Tax=Halorussus halophilus TaxID=2650975 RepID=UPI001300EF8A|nr:DUF308 domain-containing protein [Halorussus halophilus]
MSLEDDAHLLETVGDDHPILTTVGIAAVAAGVLMVVNPGFASLIGTGYFAVTMVGLLALVQGLRIARARKETDVEGVETPDVETVETMPTPGGEFDEQVAALNSGPRRESIRKRRQLRETLEAEALAAVARRENCSREEAEEMLRAGTWTDDPHAAAFLGGADAPRPPIRDRLRLAVSTQSLFQHRVRRTADAVALAADPDAKRREAGATEENDE